MNTFFLFVEDIIRNISGPVGIRLRRAYYKRRLKSAGEKIVIDTGVFITNPSYISLGDSVWVDKNVILIAGEAADKASNILVDNTIKRGELTIGHNSHVGIGTIIQAHGGVIIGDSFTSSAHCRIYSFSNIYQECKDGTVSIPERNYTPSYFSKPVIIGRNVWLGLNVSVTSTDIDDDVFIMPHSVVYKPIGKNSVATGNPAQTIKPRFVEK